MYTIQLIKKENINSIIPILQKLDPSLSRLTLEERVKDMVLNNYKCVGVFHEQKLIGISGIWILTKYYVGKHIELDNVYLLDEYQGKGIGKLLIDWILKYAKSIGCAASELNCYLDNLNAQKFWEKNGYRKIGYHYSKTL